MLHRYAVGALALLFFSGNVIALEVGFESQVLVSASDNVTGVNKNDENNGEEIEEGQLANIQFGVFGEQKGTRLTGGFAGEIYSTRRIDDPDDSFSTITQFLGAAELQVTPRSFSWYFGDILGSVRAEEGIQSIDNTNDERRNVFITGPQFVYELDGFSRVNANFYYVNQTQDDEQLDTLYNTNANWSVDTDNGNTWGTAVTNVFTDNQNDTVEGDFNRFSLAGTWSRSRARNTYNARLGGTRYDTADESINGVNAQFSIERQLAAQSVFSISLTRDLRDESLNLVQSLIDSGSGAESDVDGFFDETRLDLTYALTTAETALDVYAGVGQSEFRLLADSTGFVNVTSDLEDRTTFSAGSSVSHDFSARTRVNASLSFTKQDYNNSTDSNFPSDSTQSVLGEAQFVYRLSRSFEAQLGYRVSAAEGTRTRIAVGTGARTLEDIDSIENRVSVALRWAPPSRATKNLTIQLKSLLQ